MILSKQSLFQLLHKLGLTKLIVSSQRNKVTILMLHGVTDPAVPSAWKPLRPQLLPAHLAQTLALLSTYYQFVSLTEATEMLAGLRPLKPNSLVLTFDDGYRNSLTFALPVLRRFNAPATIFLSTGNITEQKPFWFDRLDYAVQAIGKKTTSHPKIPELAELDFSSRENLALSFVAFIRKEKQHYTTNSAFRAVMDNLSDRMEQYSGQGLTDIFSKDPWSGVLTWNEIKHAPPEIHFGSHGVDHPLLSLVSQKVAKHELVSSQEAIEFYTGRPCTSLAYPNGAFNKDVVSLAKDCGYSAAVTTKSGLNRQGSELLTLQRIAFPRAQSPAMIMSAVSGVSSFWQKIKNMTIDD